jgi:two-component system sensor histidine kinase PilS (NtrC family)
VTDDTSPATESETERDEVLARRLQLTLLGRILVATVVLGGTLLLSNSARFDAFTPRSLIWLIVAAYTVSAVSAVALVRGASAGRLAAAQIASDLVLTSGLVYLTGGAESGFSFLFGAVVLTAALVGSGRTALLVAATTLVLYGTLALGLANLWIPGPPDQDVAQYAAGGAELGRALLRNLVGLVLVGGLAATLSDRLLRTRTELARATESAAGYARLHEDVVRSLQSGLVTLDAEDRIQTANPAAATLLGVRDPDELVGTSIRRYLDVSSETVERKEDEARRHDGTPFPVGYTRTPLHSADQAPRGSIVIFQDLTELMALRKKAERAGRLAVLGSLAAGLAHEIRNPLGSIAGSVELVRDATALGDEDRKLLDTVLRETDRLNELVTTMLEVGRAGPAERVHAPLAPVAREVVALARRGAPEGLSIDLEVAPEDVSGFVDPQQVRQVLWNLVRNAIQFSPPSGRVTVRLGRDEHAVHIEVADQGAGVAEADRAHLFDMFFTRRRGGIGLGLALCKQIVDAHHGEIVARANEPRGSLFQVRFPDERPSDPARASLPPP